MTACDFEIRRMAAASTLGRACWRDFGGEFHDLREAASRPVIVCRRAWIRPPAALADAACIRLLVLAATQPSQNARYSGAPPPWAGATNIRGAGRPHPAARSRRRRGVGIGVRMVAVEGQSMTACEREMASINGMVPGRPSLPNRQTSGDSLKSTVIPQGLSRAN